MRRRKKEVEEKEEVIDAQEEGLISERWSLNKIIIGSIVLLLLFGALAYGFFYYKRYQESQGKNILGIQQTRQDQGLPTEEDVEETIETVQEELDKINPDNVFSSQDSIQKIIHDLESLRNSTTDPKGAFCSAVCGSVVVDPKKATGEADTEE